MTKQLVLLLGALALIGCGEKEKSPNSVQTGQEAGTVQEAKEEVDAVSSGPEPLISDADIERFAKDAIDTANAAKEEDYTGWSKLVHQGQLVELVQWKNGKSDGPYMLWYEDGTIREMGILKEDVEQQIYAYYPTGKIQSMCIFKAGEMAQYETYYPTGEKQSVISPADAESQEAVAWHKNGKKAGTMLMKDGEPLMKDGEAVLMKFWNEEGEELDKEEGMKMIKGIMDY